MATGKIDVLTSRVVLSGSYHNAGVEETCHLNLKRVSGCDKAIFRLSIVKGGDDDRGSSKLWGCDNYGLYVDCEDGEIVSMDDQPPEKKRKLSPGKNGQSLSHIGHASVSVRSVKEACTIAKSSSGSELSSSLDPENGAEVVACELPNIYSSRWASDDDYASDENTQVSCTINVDGSLVDDGDDAVVAQNLVSDEELMEDISDGPAESATRKIDMCEGCRSVANFERLNEINEGTYGKVYRARDKTTGEIVALKKVKMDKYVEEYGFPLTALREINILMAFSHPNVVNVKEVVMGDLDSVYMVMECMDYDLKGLMEVMKQPFSLSEVKCLMLQLLEGVKYLHDNWVLHRDLKTSNLLLNSKGELKLCDFGMARQYGSPIRPYTSLVVTLWYRAPELLLGAKQYSTALDMWSVGCIMAELLSKEPLFPGKTEIEQLKKIFQMLGTPNEKIWPGLSLLPGAKAHFSKQPYNLLRKRFPATSFMGSPALSEKGFDLLNSLLTYDPEKRITAKDALNHPWFAEVPLPMTKEFISTFPPQCTKAR